MLRVCFVCLGNICRSPTAEGVLQQLIDERGLGDALEVESAGTGAWHAGSSPDPRTCDEARRHGLELVSRARRFVEEDFARFDCIVAMDRRNAAYLRELARDEDSRRKICLLRDFDPSAAGERDVPDPYMGGAAGFELVFAICQRACKHLLDAELMPRIS